MNNTEVFSFIEGSKNFEDFSQSNDITYWFARDLLKMLEYSDFTSFEKAINRALVACSALNIPIMDNFIQVRRDINGSRLKDYKLTRFACYLTVMNADVKKTNVAKAQVYFATVAEVIRQHIEEVNRVERVTFRKELADSEKTLSGVAKAAGVEEYALFQNAGYRGMYNMNLKSLKLHKGLTDIKRPLLDYMGSYELAANLFRLKQTEAEIQVKDVKGQKDLERTAESVGQAVRDIMIKRGGKKPEDLPLDEDIRTVKKELKQTHKKLKQKDKEDKNRRKK